jgi:hypothetical protein
MKGYPYFKRQIREHIVVAERVLGHELPPKAQVHHANRNRTDNRTSNLVICEDQAYHSLLHKRMRALEACGDANWAKCVYCHCYDCPANLTRRLVSRRMRQYCQTYHNSCRATYEQQRKEKRRWRTFGEIAHPKNRPDYQSVLG